MVFKYNIRKEPNGWYSADVPSLPGCVSEGQTEEECRANIIEAAEGVMSVLAERYRKEATAELDSMESEKTDSFAFPVRVRRSNKRSATAIA